MDIPDSLRNFLKLDAGVEKRLESLQTLVTPENKGNLISLAALAEEEIASFLTRYFAVPARAEEFQTMMANTLTFHLKIETLAKVLPNIDPIKENYEPHLRFLKALKKLRNAAAHSYGISAEEAIRLSTDSEAVLIITDFPKNLWSQVTSLRDYLNSLLPTSGPDR